MILCGSSVGFEGGCRSLIDQAPPPPPPSPPRTAAAQQPRPCKHRKDAKNALTKDEHGQLLTSQQWAQDNYPKRKIVGFIVHPTDESTKPAAAEKTSVLTLAKLGELVGVARQFYTDLCSSTAQGAALEKVCAELLAKHGLTAEDIGKRFLTTLFKRV